MLAHMGFVWGATVEVEVCDETSRILTIGTRGMHGPRCLLERAGSAMGGLMVSVGPQWVSLSHGGCIWIYTNGIQALRMIISRLEIVFGQNSLSYEEAVIG